MKKKKSTLSYHILIVSTYDLILWKKSIFYSGQIKTVLENSNICWHLFNRTSSGFHQQGYSGGQETVNNDMIRSTSIFWGIEVQTLLLLVTCLHVVVYGVWRNCRWIWWIYTKWMESRERFVREAGRRNWETEEVEKHK